jgi:hypothetical protein
MKIKGSIVLVVSILSTFLFGCSTEVKKPIISVITGPVETGLMSEIPISKPIRIITTPIASGITITGDHTNIVSS